jgi:SAM-dependent methyltransferase
VTPSIPEHRSIERAATIADLGALVEPAHPFECRACAVRRMRRRFKVLEMNLGLGDPFEYAECSTCGSLTLLDPPVDIRRYYPPGAYYSLRRRWLVDAADRTFRSRISFGRFPRCQGWLERQELTDTALSAVGRLDLPRDAAILDVGAGTGRLVRILGRLGYVHVLGVEPLLDELAPPDPQLRRGGIESARAGERFDLVMFHHSLEHIPDPLAALQRSRAHLSERGSVLIRLPLVTVPFHRFGVAWYGIDAPRHSFVPTEDGLTRLLQRAGFVPYRRYYDSTSAQFTVSERFRQGWNAVAQHAVHPSRLVLDRLSSETRAAMREAAAANRSGTGDQIVVYARAAPG